LDGIAEQRAAAHGIDPERTAAAGLLLEDDADCKRRRENPSVKRPDSPVAPE
jgi:hypothetical protein